MNTDIYASGTRYANHEIYVEVDDTSPTGLSFGFSCLYSECYGLDCPGQQLTYLLQDDFAENGGDYKPGDVYISVSGGGGYFGDTESEMDWEYAQRDPNFDAVKELARWKTAHEEPTVYIKLEA